MLLTSLKRIKRSKDLTI